MDTAQERRILSKARSASYRGKGHVIYRLLISGILVYVLVCFGMIIVPAVQFAMGFGSGTLEQAWKKTGKLLSPLFIHALEKESEAKKVLKENEEARKQGESTIIETANGNTLDVTLSGNVEVIFGEGYYEDTVMSEAGKLAANRKLIQNLKNSMDYTYLLKNFYIVDGSTTAVEDIFQPEELLGRDMSIVKDARMPQILIHHTHGSETFADSRSGVKEDTVIGMGIELARLLSEEYGYQVIHDKTAYDMMEGSLERSKAYNYAEEGTLSILEEYPSIQVIIDLHRDGGKKRVTTVNGKRTAQIMFFNGLSRNMNGPISYLYNPYIKDNLAFSLQLKLAAMEQFADFSKNIYLKGYEYNLSLMPRSLLIEVGTSMNTVEEAKNAMEPLAQILDQVLTGTE